MKRAMLLTLLAALWLSPATGHAHQERLDVSDLIGLVQNFFAQVEARITWRINRFLDGLTAWLEPPAESPSSEPTASEPTASEPPLSEPPSSEPPPGSSPGPPLAPLPAAGQFLGVTMSIGKFEDGVFDGMDGVCLIIPWRAFEQDPDRWVRAAEKVTAGGGLFSFKFEIGLTKGRIPDRVLEDSALDWVANPPLQDGWPVRLLPREWELFFDRYALAAIEDAHRRLGPYAHVIYLNGNAGSSEMYVTRTANEYSQLPIGWDQQFRRVQAKVWDAQERGLGEHRNKQRALSFTRVHLPTPLGGPTASRWVLDQAIRRYPGLIVQQDGFSGNQPFDREFGDNSVYGDIVATKRPVAFELLPRAEVSPALEAAQTWKAEAGGAGLRWLHLWPDQVEALLP